MHTGELDRKGFTIILSSTSPNWRSTLRNDLLSYAETCFITTQKHEIQVLPLLRLEKI